MINFPAAQAHLMNLMNLERLVDLSGIPLPKDTPEQRSIQARLAPHVGVSAFVPQQRDPIAERMRLAIARHGDAPGGPGHGSGRHVPRFASPVSPARCHLVLRGWYGTREEPRWCPCQSLFGGRAGRHGGVDLAAPAGTVVHAPLDGLAEFNPLGDDTPRGNHLFAFTPANPPLGVVLCHLKHPLGHFPRRVSAGEPLALVGDSGATIYGGRPNIFGKYDSHVHVEVLTLEGDQACRLDPLAALGIRPLFLDDARCFFPADPTRLTVRVAHPLLERG